MRGNRIFGIGLPKTGTSSLRKALVTLGYRTKHDPFHFRNIQYETNAFEFEGKWDALVNFGEWYFKELDETYPESKFILTTRDFDSWIKSAKSQFSKKRNVRNKIRTEIFGCARFDKEIFTSVYNAHTDCVLEYFESQYPDSIGEKLLIIDLCNDDKLWEKICLFLDKPVPEREFPKRNVNKKLERKRNLE